MGTRTSIVLQPPQSEMSDMRYPHRHDIVMREEIEIYSVCCCEVRRVYKEIWKSNFEHNCQELITDYKWVGKVLEAYNQGAKLSRKNYYQSMHKLRVDHGKNALLTAKTLQLPQIPNNNEIRDLVKKSVILMEDIRDLGTRSRPRTSMRSERLSHRSTVKIQPGRRISQRLSGMSALTNFDDSMKSIFTQEKKKDGSTVSMGTEIEKAQNLLLFVHFSELLQKHCDDPYCSLTAIKQSFIEYMHENFSKVKNVTESIVDTATKDILQFIRLYKETIFDYYKLEFFEDISPTHNLFTDTNIMNVVTSILFKDSTLYKIIFSLYEKVEMVKEQQLQKSLQNFRDLEPQDFDIKAQYCLNQTTLEWALNKGAIDKMPKVTEKFYPYDRCIRKLRQIEDIRTPISKLKVVARCSDKITQSINQFNEKFNIPTKNSMIDADQVLSIYSYMACMSRIRCLSTHLRIIQSFSNEQQMLSITGYYYSVLLCALENLRTRIEQKIASSLSVSGRSRRRSIDTTGTDM